MDIDEPEKQWSYQRPFEYDVMGEWTTMDLAGHFTRQMLGVQPRIGLDSIRQGSVFWDTTILGNLNID